MDWTVGYSADMKNNQKGFTLVELLIATTIFSTMMLLATAGILQIGKIYYKGFMVTKTQEATRIIVDDISRNIQTGAKAKVERSSPGTYQAVCVGLVRYSYTLDVQLGPVVPASKHVVWVDRIQENMTVPGGQFCPSVDLSSATPADYRTDSIATRGRELMGTNMRLINFEIEPSATSSQPVHIKVKVVYGEPDLSPPPDYLCAPTEQGGQFCAVAELETFVKPRL